MPIGSTGDFNYRVSDMSGGSQVPASKKPISSADQKISDLSKTAFTGEDWRNLTGPFEGLDRDQAWEKLDKMLGRDRMATPVEVTPSADHDITKEKISAQRKSWSLHQGEYANSSGPKEDFVITVAHYTGLPKDQVQDWVDNNFKTKLEGDRFIEYFNNQGKLLSKATDPAEFRDAVNRVLIFVERFGFKGEDWQNLTGPFKDLNRDEAWELLDKILGKEPMGTPAEVTPSADHDITKEKISDQRKSWSLHQGEYANSSGPKEDFVITVAHYTGLPKDQVQDWVDNNFETQLEGGRFSEYFNNQGKLLSKATEPGEFRDAVNRVLIFVERFGY